MALTGPEQPQAMIALKTVCFILCCLTIVLSLCFPLYGEPVQHSLSLRERIDELLADTLLQKGMTGIRVIDAADGKVLYELNSENYFPPASNMKLITTAGALFLLEPEFRFKTPILARGNIEDDTLTGDLIIYGKGDPTLSVSHLDAIAQQVAVRGISVINGDLVFDDTYFDSVPYGPGWMWDDLQYSFGAPISALSVNRNALAIYLLPGTDEAEGVRVSTVPDAETITVENRARTGMKGNVTVTTSSEDGTIVITVNGSLPAGTGPYRFERTIEEPARFTAVLLGEALARKGISVTGTVRRKKREGKVDTLFIHTSEPLLKILYDLDKYSVNLTAEHILKTIGAEINGKPGTSEKGVAAIASYLQEHGIVTDSIIQRDGSGLSRYNLITPKQVTSILHYLYFDFARGPELLTVLPVAGTDGTLSGRLRDPSTNRKVRAKTGTMTHVSTLSGYCITASGRILIFSIMMKDYPAAPSHVRTIQDRIVAALIERL